MLTLMFALMLSAAPLQTGPEPAPPQTQRIELKKDGGPGHGFGQPYDVREQGASDLERFVGGKQVVFVGPWDIILLALIVILVVVLIIAL